jgi:4-amino-4-deoxy-L-arabinose transferase-like glycosyltransferase
MCFANVVRIGGDDGFELSKAFLLFRKPGMTSQMWNDQPWLHTMVTAAAFHVFGPTAVIPRLISLASLIVILISAAYIMKGRCGLLEHAAFGALFITGSQALPLSTSAMLELPAAAAGMAGSAIACVAIRRRNWRWSVMTGVLLAICAHIKLTGLIVAPAVFVFWITCSGLRRGLKQSGCSMAGFLVTFCALAALSPRFSLHELLSSHLAAAMHMSNALTRLHSFHIRSVLSDLPLFL